MKLSKKTAIENHRKMWRELAKSGAKYKPELDILLDCWLCEYDNENCGECLLQWPEVKDYGYGVCPCTRSYFGIWVDSKSCKVRKTLARKIANLKESK